MTKNFIYKIHLLCHYTHNTTNTMQKNEQKGILNLSYLSKFQIKQKLKSSQKMHTYKNK